MAAVCSHKDEERKGVSVTAHGVAYMRSVEDHVAPELRLFHDPYAAILGGEEGKSFIESRHKGKPAINLVNGLSVRTRRIDDEFKDSQLLQICVFGAGLDTRPWRLKKTVHHPVDYFEVDFPEIFAFKIPTLEAANAVSEFIYHAVNTDLSLNDWSDKLIADGFDPTKPTFFILEGFINYLTKDEAISFFTAFSNKLACPGSRLVMTCATPITMTTTSMHRFFPENPLEFFTQFGWSGKQELVGDLAVAYGRALPTDNDAGMKGYYIVTAERI